MAKTRSPRHASLFSRIARSVARASGEPITFVLSAAIVLAWALSGPVFNFSDTWQLFINTGTTVATFLMVFLIQNSQNTDSVAVQIKLDELIRAVSNARNSRLSTEELDQKDLDGIRDEYRKLANRAKRTESAAPAKNGGTRSRGKAGRRKSASSNR